ncbi:MAG: integrin alpha, partial [Myxococcota bacterium]
AGDWAGDAVSLVGDLDGDGLAELLVGAPGADDGATDGGAAWRVSGASIAAGGDVTDADGAFVWPGAAGWAGMAVGGDADFALVGVPADGTLGYGAGAVWQLAWSGDTEVAGAAGLVYHGDDADAHAGVGVVPLADLDGEGGAFATGAPGFDHGRGAVYVAP